jgi:S-adenosylmethionine:tRNA ribosyltransferase-isomerase
VRLDEFSYHLPESLIAQHPTRERTASRLLVASRRGDASPVHATFHRLPEFLRRGDVLAVNRTRVVPARLLARRADGLEFEVFFLRALDDRAFVAWVRPLRKLRTGDVLRVGDASLRFAGRQGEREARFDTVGSVDVDACTIIERFGHVPLPPYIRRTDEPADRERYQTVFAREPGSVAAPTAGLHFDEAMLAALAARGVDVRSLVLHVGPGTFQPLEHDEVEANRLASEPFEIDVETLSAVASAKRDGRRVVAVGTTATRALETAAARGWLDPPFEDRRGETDLFIHPGFEFRAVDALLTNFHLPRSSLLVLVCAFMGTDRTLALYNEAVAREYRFYSYGDAMLVA